MSIQRTLLVSLSLFSALLSGAAATAAELKVGIVDQRRGILTTDQGKQAQKDLEKLAEERKSRLKPAQDDFQKKQEELESQRFVLSETALEDLHVSPALLARLAGNRSESNRPGWRELWPEARPDGAR